jgi:ABC-2 type transport system permease protein
VGRVLSGTLPGMDIIYRLAHNPIQVDIDGPQDFVKQISVGANYTIFAMPQIWIGIVLGALMIYAAIRLRGNRDEG